MTPCDESVFRTSPTYGTAGDRDGAWRQTHRFMSFRVSEIRRSPIPSLCGRCLASHPYRNGFWKIHDSSMSISRAKRKARMILVPFYPLGRYLNANVIRVNAGVANAMRKPLTRSQGQPSPGTAGQRPAAYRDESVQRRHRTPTGRMVRAGSRRGKTPHITGGGVGHRFVGGSRVASG